MRIHHTPGDDAGITLVETLVSMALLLVVGAIVLAATVATHKTTRVADDETRGQEDVAVVVDRLSRDIRDARGVVCDGAASDPTCKTHLQLWVDYNSDYKQQSAETITWKLQPGADGVHFDMVRVVGPATQVVARTIVENVAFSYPDDGSVGPVGSNPAPVASQPPPGVRVTRAVATAMTYDAVTNGATGSRKVVFTTLLRNVP